MSKTRALGERLFILHFNRIEQAIHAVARWKCLSADERDELYSLTMLKIILDDFAVLRKYLGRSSWQSYLTVVVQRVLLDFRVAKWGRWRPSTKAKRLGPLGVWLDRRIHRDDLEPKMAIRELRDQGLGSPEELERLVAQLPHRPRRRFVSSEHLATLRCEPTNDTSVYAHEHRVLARELKKALLVALRDLPEDDRKLVERRYVKAETVKAIADHYQLDARRLYRRYEQILRTLRRRLSELGVVWRDVKEILDSSDGEARGYLELE
ncbi:MAG: sigma-70 family RNA polymerase sigma factor [Acidobacteriota bacterium]